MQRFKAKKKIKLIKTKYVVYLVIITLISTFTFNYLHSIKYASNNEEFIKYLLEDSNHYKNYNSKIKKIIYKISNLISGIDTSKPVTLLESRFLYKSNYKESSVKLSNKEEKILTQNEVNFNKNNLNQNNDTKETSNQKVVYIYNTHQTEKYAYGNLKDFGITPDVMMVTYLLQDRLSKKGIKVLVEERRMSDYLKQNNWDYNMSYYASRVYAQGVLSTNKTDLIIDLHRDALSKDLSTTTINGKNYAKVLFVVGGKPSTYTENIKVVNALNDLIKQSYPTLTRGILTRKESTYNQDLSNHSILLELGAQENTIDEVMNTVEIIASVIANYLGGTSGN